MTDEKAPADATNTNGGSARTGTRRLTPGMRAVLVAVCAVVLLGAVVTIWLLTAGAPSGPTAGTQAPTALPTTVQGPVPGATSTTGSEVQSPDPQTEVDGDDLPASPGREPLVGGPLPPSGSASGTLVEGFPASVMGPADGSDIVESSIATQDSTMQVALVARSTASADDIRAHYRALWSGFGLSDAGADAGADTAYADALTSLSLGFSPGSGTGTVYTIYGVFRAN